MYSQLAPTILNIHSFLAFPKCGITYLLIVWNVRIILLLNDIHRHFLCNFNYALLTRIVYYNNYSICIMLYIL